MIPPMGEASTEALQDAIRHMHGCESTYIRREPVHEQHDGQTVWRGEVIVFALDGHPTASQAYAWSYETDGGKRRFFAVLHAGPVDSAARAVQAAILSNRGA